METIITSLTDLAAQYYNGYQRSQHGRDEWRDGVLEMAGALYVARQQFSADQEFSAWLTENGMDQFNKDDRAALIKMGEHLEAARQVLSETKSNSIQLIWRKEIQPQFLNAKKPKPKPDKAPKDHYKQAEIAVLHDDGLTHREIADKLGLGKRTVDEVMDREMVKRTAQANITPEMLSMTAQQKLELAIRQHKEKLTAQYRIDVSAEVTRMLTETIGPRLKKEQDLAKREMERRKGIMDKKTYLKIWSCLHPDWVTDHKQKERYADAFHLFSNMEKLLLDEKESPTEFVSIPKTAAEWEEKKRQVMAARKAKRAASNLQPK